MSQERHLQVSLRPLQVPPELLLELSWNRTLELNLERTALPHLQRLLLHRKLEHFGKRTLRLLQSKVALYLSPVLYLDRLIYRLVDEDVSEVNLLLSEIGLWPQALPFKLQRQSFLSTRNVTVGNAIVGIGLGGHESDSYCDLAIGPYLTHKGFDFKYVILEKEKIVLDGFADGFVLTSQSKLGSLFLSLP